MVSLSGHSVYHLDVLTVWFCLLAVSQAAYVNVALNKPAYIQDPIYRGDIYDASNAVDGRKSYLSLNGDQCALSLGRQTATWWVNLTTIHSIHHITIYFRTENDLQVFYGGLSNYYLGFSVYVSNTTDRLQGTLCYKDDNFTLDTIPPVFTTTCPVHGQYVIFYNERLPGVTYPRGYSTDVWSHLCEVEVYDEASKKWALVLFDWDGCTAIIESKRLVGNDDKKVGSKFKLSFDGKLHEVEILDFGYEDHHLHAKDNHWDRSSRAKAISAVRDARELTRRGKYGGYLDIHDSDDSDEDEEAILSPVMSHLRTRANPNCRKTTSKKQPQKTSTPSAQQQAQQRPQETQRKNIEGTNGRSVTILYEGSGDYEGHSSPKRQPCSFEDLTSDQVDIILNQVESSQKNLISTMTMTDDIVIVQSEEDITALCKDCNGTHHSQPAVQTQLKDIKSSQKALEQKVDSLLEILTTFVKKQETCVTIDLNTSSFVIEPECTPPSKVTKALNNILTTSVVSTNAQDTSGAKIPFNTSILEDTCDTSTTSNNLTTGRTSTTGNILTTLRASTTSKNSNNSTTGNNSTSNTQTTSKTPTSSTPSTGNLTGRTLSTDNNLMGSTSSTGNNLTGSTSSTGNLTGRTLSTGSNSMGSTPSTGNSTGTTSSTGNNSTGSTPSTDNWTGHTVSTDNSMGSTPSTVSTSSTGNNSTGSTPSTIYSTCSTPSSGNNSTSSTPSTANNSTGSILMSGKTTTSNTPSTGNNSLGNTLIGSTPSMFITSSMVGTSTPVTSFETTFREEPRVLLIDASNEELPPPVCETIAELVLVEENEENVAPSLENRNANQMKRPRLQRMKRFPSPCKANAITTYIRSSEDVEPGNYEILVCPDVLMEIKDRSCSDGNFLLNTARRIFKEEELEGKNYSGRPGISPRRKHALQHAFAEHCSSNIDDFKRAVIALNSGIRGLAFK